MAEAMNLAILLLEAFVYFALMAALLHLRHRIGLGVFLTALGVMHFVETYLAAVFYVNLPFGVVSPGSSVFFAGKLILILMLYIKEDAAVVRQPIYGLFLGNLVTLAVARILLLHTTVSLGPGQTVDLGFLEDMGLLMLWGTALLYVDSIAIILIYERLGRWLSGWTSLRLAFAAMIVLTFDQIGFYGVLHLVYGAPPSVFWGGWQAKMMAAAFYGVLFMGFQLIARERGVVGIKRSLRDIFSELTFRERYEDLLARSGRDILTGANDRGRLESEGPRILRECLRQQDPVSLIVVDIDHFKDVNDRFGHQRGDLVLQQTVAALQHELRPRDPLFRYGGEEFVILLPQIAHDEAVAVAERLRRTLSERVLNDAGETMTASFGVGTAPMDGEQFTALFKAADERLYRAKREGRDRVVGAPVSGSPRS